MATHLPQTALKRLVGLRTTYGPSAAKDKLKLFSSLKSHLQSTRDLITYHEILLFILAYPDNQAVHHAARQALDRTAETIAMKVKSSRSSIDDFENSGIAGTLREDSFSLDLLSWLLRDCEVRGSIALPKGNKKSSLSDLLQSALLTIDSDAALNALSTEKLLQIAAGDSPTRWILSALQSLQTSPQVKDHVFNNFEFWLTWTVSRQLSRTYVRFPFNKIYFHQDVLRTNYDPSVLMKSPIPKPRPCEKKKALRLIAAARASLAARGRETDPVTYAYQKEIYWYGLERGISVAVYGLPPERRLPIETYLGFVASKNGLPIAYGGAWILGEFAEIGVNIFDTFRGGDSAYLFTQIMRVYCQAFGVRHFSVHPQQFGEGNEEGLSSGAFWFYYRLGFRPEGAKAQSLAHKEMAAISKNPRYRTPQKVLKNLITERLLLSIEPANVGRDSELDVRDIGLALLDFVGKKFKGDHRAAEMECVLTLRKLLRIASRSRNGDEEALRRFSILGAALPTLRNWSMQEKRDLLAILKAKTGSREELYLRTVQNHHRLLHDLRALTKQGQAIAKKFSAPQRRSKI